MPVLKDGKVIADTWISVSDDDAIPDAGDVFISLPRFLSETDVLKARQTGAVGVLLQPDDSPAALASDFDTIKAIAVNFPRFTDGRGCSTARLLRVRYGFQGEIRAVGDVLPDQIAFMARCGIDAFVLSSSHIETARERVAGLGVAYQMTVNGPTPAWRRRWAQPQNTQTTAGVE